MDQTKLVLNRTSAMESLVPNRTNTMGVQHQYSTGSGLLAPTSNSNYCRTLYTSNIENDGVILNQ